MNNKPKTVFRWILACFFILAGWNHFRDPALYLSMMPPYLPRPELLNAVSGLAEIAGGMGVLIPRLRRPAAWGLIALLVAIFPANIHVAMNGWAGANLAPWTLWLRLPFQLLFIGWVYWACLGQSARETHPNNPLKTKYWLLTACVFWWLQVHSNPLAPKPGQPPVPIFAELGKLLLRTPSNVTSSATCP